MNTRAGMLKKAREAMESYYRNNKITKEEYQSLCDAQNAMERDLDTLNHALEKITGECNGEAHSNAFIDNCMICAPQWGKVLKEEYRNG